MSDDALDLTAEERNALLAHARRSLEDRLRDRPGPRFDPAWLAQHPRLEAPRAVFVTLERRGKLRGCIGELVARRPLHRAVAQAAVEAALHDPRFPAVQFTEAPELILSITVLSPPQPIDAETPQERLAALRPGEDGVILEYDGRRSTFLPQVWRQLPEPREFLRRLAEKQGSPPDAWQAPEARLSRYTGLSFGEGD